MNAVGMRSPRHDARGKVTGETKYPADLFDPGMLRLGTVFAHRAHARIVAIDVADALLVPGVIAVLTARDVPHNRYGLIEDDQPVLCEDVVRYEGDRVALVIATDDRAAARGVGAVRVAYEDLPLVSDAAKAMQPDCPRVHDDRSNVLHHQPIRKGDTGAAFAAADVVLSGEFTTSWQEHAYLQPDAGIAYYEGDALVIETAGQWLHEDRRQLAAILGLPEERVIVRYAAIGGAFGGREDLSVAALLALATFVTKRPTALRWTREESIVGHHKRHPFAISTRWGALRDGTITAVETTLVADGGAYASTSAEVLKCAAIFAQGPYEIANVTTDAYVCYTNNVPSGAFRGFGTPQAHFAAESMIARIAERLGLDPRDVRRKNLYREGSREATGCVLPAGVSAVPVLDRCVAEAARRPLGRHTVHNGAGENGAVVRGRGFACGIKNVGYSFGYPEQARAAVELVILDGIRGARVRIAVADVGQGTHLAMRQIAAQRLGLAVEHVEIIADDSSQAPNAGSASASRLTLFAGRAVHDAAEAALRNYRSGGEPRAFVQYVPPETTPLEPGTGQGRPNICYGYSAQAVDVEVDRATGVVRVTRVISVHDVGRAINPQQVEAQIEGCVAQAIGYTITEDFRVRDGRVLTPNFTTYLLPTSLDVPPEIVPVILEHRDPNGPFGARGMAEMPLVPFAAAVAAAVHDATGAWVSDLPMTPERVLAALEVAAARHDAIATLR
jgi:CO/xanthine dehydrogenase Mo-binding subunit